MSNARLHARLTEPPAPEPEPRTRAPRRGTFDPELFFGHQRTPRCELPDPTPLVENLTRCVLEVLAGARDLEQLARWINRDVYANLLKRTILAARARTLSRRTAMRPLLALGPVHLCAPADGIVEAVTVVTTKTRARAVAIRLEGIDGRWRASAIAVL